MRKDRRNALYRWKRGHLTNKMPTKTLTTTSKRGQFKKKDNDKEGNYVKDNPQKVRSLPGVRSRHQNIDTVIIRWLITLFNKFSGFRFPQKNILLFKNDFPGSRQRASTRPLNTSQWREWLSRWRWSPGRSHTGRWLGENHWNGHDKQKLCMSLGEKFCKFKFCIFCFLLVG